MRRVYVKAEGCYAPQRTKPEARIETLMKYGWVEEVQTAEGRKYRLKENGKTEAVKKLFRELGYL